MLGALRQRGQKGCPIVPTDNTLVKHDNDTPISCAPDQAAKPLTQTQHSLGHRVLPKWIIKVPAPRRENGIGGHRERQPDDHEIAKSRPNNVNTFPETPRAQ